MFRRMNHNIRRILPQTKLLRRRLLRGLNILLSSPPTPRQGLRHLSLIMPLPIPTRRLRMDNIVMYTLQPLKSTIIRVKRVPLWTHTI